MSAVNHHVESLTTTIEIVGPDGTRSMASLETNRYGDVTIKFHNKRAAESLTHLALGGCLLGISFIHLPSTPE